MKAEVSQKVLPEKKQQVSKEVKMPMTTTEESKKEVIVKSSQSVVFPQEKQLVPRVEQKLEKPSVSEKQTESFIPIVETPQKTSVPPEKEKELKEDTQQVPVVEQTKPLEKPKEIYRFEKLKFPLAHKVSSGETLISIAEKYYNNSRYWTKIYNANKDKIIKGNLKVGETIIIPEP